MLGVRRRQVQVGRGLGSIFSTIFKKITPIAKSLYNIGKRIFSSAPVQKVAKNARDTALQSGVQIVDDVIQGKNVGESIKSNVKTASKRIANDAAEEAKRYLEGKKSRPPNKPKLSKKKAKRIKKNRNVRSRQDVWNEAN